MAANPYLLASLQDPEFASLYLQFAPYLEDDHEPTQYGPPMQMSQPSGMDQWQPQLAGEEPGFLARTAAHVAHGLSLVNRPNSALWSAVKAAQGGGSALEGARRGFMGEEDTGLADILGLAEGKPTDEWLPWLGKEGVRLGANMLGDPLSYLFAAPKTVMGGVSLASRGARALGSDALLRALYDLPQAKYVVRSLNPRLYPEFTGAVNESDRLLGHKLLDIGDLAEASRNAIKNEHPGISPVDINEMYARTPELLGPESRAALDAQKGFAGAEREALNQKLDQFNLPQIQIAPEGPGTGRVNWGPRPDTQEGARLLSRQPARQALTPEAFGETEFVRLVDPKALEQGIVSSPVGLEAPFVTKKSYLKGMEVEGAPNTYAFKGGEGVPIPATSKDIVEATNLGLLGENFKATAQVHDLPPAYAIDAARKARQGRYLDLLDTLKNEKQIEYLKPGELPGNSKWAEVDIPRMAKTASGQEGEAVRIFAPPAIRNMLENMAAKHFDPTTPLGGLGDAMQHVFERTWPGQQISKMKNLFNAATLPLHPGWQVGNILSDTGLLMQGGQNPVQAILNRLGAINVARGAGETLPGASNQWLKRELEARGTGANTWGGSLAGDMMEEARRSPAFGGIPGLSQIGEAGHALTQGGYKFGQMVESNARTAAALGFLKKEFPDFATLSPGDKAVALDRAAEFARNSLVNYDVTPFEKQLQNIIPYLSWQKGIATRTGELALTQPQRLNRFGQTLDTFLEPLSEEDKQTADPWIRESMPISGAFGGKLPESGGLPGMAMVGRGVPQGDLDRILGRPLDYAISSVNPLLKLLGYELPANRNTQKDQPMDTVADGFPGLLTNALTGKPYQLAGEKTLGMRLPAAYQTALSELPGGRYLNELNTLGRTAGAWEDPTKPEMTPTEAAIWYLTGGKNFPFDQAKYLKNRQREYAQQKNAIKSQAKYFAGKGDEEATNAMLEALAAYATRSPLEGRW